VTYSCSNCGVGILKPTKITFLRRIGSRMITLPNFAAWTCDACHFTRYDNAALARIELVLGPDFESVLDTVNWRFRATHGPAEHGPHRWSY
jgi:YgiT-type zinc finger domain-containing protein